MLRGLVLFEFRFHLESLASALSTAAATQYQTESGQLPNPSFSASHVRVGAGENRWRQLWKVGGFRADSVGAVLASEGPVSWKSGTPG